MAPMLVCVDRGSCVAVTGGFRLNERDDKAETQKQWNTDPCGAETAAEHAPGTAAFFRRIDTERYDPTRPGCAPAWASRASPARRSSRSGRARHGPRAVRPGRGEDVRPGSHAAAPGADRASLRGRGARTRLVRGDAERLPLADGSFDVVYAFGVLHHTPAIAQAVDEIRRVLRPGGRPSWASTTATRPSTGSTPCSGAGSDSASCGARGTCACSRTSSTDPRARRPCPSSRS